MLAGDLEYVLPGDAAFFRLFARLRRLFFRWFPRGAEAVLATAMQLLEATYGARPWLENVPMKPRARLLGRMALAGLGPDLQSAFMEQVLSACPETRALIEYVEKSRVEIHCELEDNWFRNIGVLTRETVDLEGQKPLILCVWQAVVGELPGCPRWPALLEACEAYASGTASRQQLLDFFEEPSSFPDLTDEQLLVGALNCVGIKNWDSPLLDYTFRLVCFDDF